MALSGTSNPFKPWTWFGKLWTWVFGSDEDRVTYTGNAPEGSRSSGVTSGASGSNTRRPGSSSNSDGSDNPLTRPPLNDEDVDSYTTPKTPSIFEQLGDPDSPIGNLVSSLAARLTGAHLTGAEREANAFTAEQAEINRTFQSAEAEKAREWQEQQYLMYNSPAAQMRQYQEAGINPVMVAGGNMPAASTSTAAPTGSAGSSVTPHQPSDLVSGLIDLMKFKAEKRLVDSQAKEHESNAELNQHRIDNMDQDTEQKSIQNHLDRTFGELERQGALDKLRAEIDDLAASKELKDFQRQYMDQVQRVLDIAKTKHENISAAIDQWRSDYIQKNQMDPNAPMVNQMLTRVTAIIDYFKEHRSLSGFRLPSRR